jgi:hypothetical protein
MAHRVYDIEATKEALGGIKQFALKQTDTHEVRGTGRDDQVPARAVAAIRKKE